MLLCCSEEPPVFDIFFSFIYIRASALAADPALAPTKLSEVRSVSSPSSVSQITYLHTFLFLVLVLVLVPVCPVSLVYVFLVTATVLSPVKANVSVHIFHHHAPSNQVFFCFIPGHALTHAPALIPAFTFFYSTSYAGYHNHNHPANLLFTTTTTVTTTYSKCSRR